MTDIVCISDTHTKHRQVQVPPGDILVHSGDFCGRGDVVEISSFLDWIESLPHELKIVVPGNHDVCLEFNLEARNEFKKSGVHLLIDSDFTDMKSGLSFYGVPWTPDFYPDTWSFQYSRAGCTPTMLWDKVPSSIDIIISHGPPYGCADQVLPGSSSHLGSSFFASRIEQLVDSLKGVICGHIHGGYGTHELFGVPIINASICTESYAAINPPIVLSI
jgi:Icc-related predicted phosphoesterase